MMNGPRQGQRPAHRPRLRRSGLEFLEDRALLTAAVYQVVDINESFPTQPYWTFPPRETELYSKHTFVATNDAVYYTSLNELTPASPASPALWKSDGTSSGTKAIWAPPPDIDPQITGLTNVNGKVYFRATGDGSGPEPWRSDGTSSGTWRLADIRPGIAGSEASDFSPVGGQVFFVANDGTHGLELWRTDGTPGGTSLVRDIHPGAEGTKFGPIADLGGTAIFKVYTGESGCELWRSDGSSSGTERIRSFAEGSIGFWIDPLLVVDDQAFFWANDGVTGQELWTTDGTSSGTRLVADLGDGALSSESRHLTVVGNRLYFYDPRTRTIYSTDGTNQGLVSVRDLSQETDASLSWFFSLRNEFWYALDRSVGSANRWSELWGPDGDPPVLVSPPVAYDLAIPARPVEFNDEVYFLTQTHPSGFSGEALWRSDGTADGTFPVATVPRVDLLAATDDRLFFGRIYEEELRFPIWTSDGTSSGTRLVRGEANNGGSYPLLGGAVGGRLVYWQPQEPATSWQTAFWQSTGTATGTAFVAEVVPDVSNLPNSLRFTSVGNLSFFAGWDSSSQRSTLWRTDGTPSGTYQLGGSGLLDVGGFREFRGALYFYADDGIHGRELWRSDGTQSGTVLIRDLNPGRYSSIWPSPEIPAPVNAGGTLFFAAYRSQKVGLWQSDGSSAGTEFVAELPSDTFYSPLRVNLQPSSGVVYFQQGTGGFPYEKGPWISNGTSSGTGWLADVIPGSACSDASILLTTPTRMFYRDCGGGYYFPDLKYTDGTPAGTGLVNLPPPDGAYQRSLASDSLVDASAALYFVTNRWNSQFLPDLWRLPAGGQLAEPVVLPAGTSELANITPVVGYRGGLIFTAKDRAGQSRLGYDDGQGAARWLADNLRIDPPRDSADIWYLPDEQPWRGQVAGQLVFTANDIEHGNELWVTDGTRSGTRLLADVRPGPAGATIVNPTVVGRAVYFSADDGSTGAELFVAVIDPLIPGDANGDGVVGAADYAVWAAQFGLEGSGLEGDFDNNRSVGVGDYALWAANFGRQFGDAGAASGARATLPAAAASLRLPPSAEPTDVTPKPAGVGGPLGLRTPQPTAAPEATPKAKEPLVPQPTAGSKFAAAWSRAKASAPREELPAIVALPVTAAAPVSTTPIVNGQAVRATDRVFASWNRQR